MTAACSGELSTLASLVSSCPADNELILFCNVAGQTGGYAFRTWGNLKSCLLAGLTFDTVQFTVGQGGSPMNPGDDTLTITQNNIIQGSVFITLGGSELPQNDTSQISYSVTYSDTNVIIVFDQGVQSGQPYIVHFAYLT